VEADNNAKRGQWRRQNSGRIFGTGIYVEDDPADREKHHLPPENQLSVRPLHWRFQLLGQNGLMKTTGGRLSDYEIRAMAAVTPNKMIFVMLNASSTHRVSSVFEATAGL
jgi:hypothetical protein